MCTEPVCFLGEANEQDSRIQTSMQSSDQMSDIWKWACTCFIVLSTFKCKLRFCPSRWVLRLPGCLFAASCFFFPSPWIQHFCLHRQERKPQKKGKKAIHMHLKLWRYWKVFSLLKGTDPRVIVGKSCSRYPVCFLTEQSNFSIFTKIIWKGIF